MTPDVNVILWNFPNNGREMVVQNEDGSYTILINSKLSDEGRLHAYEHAMKHISDNDFERENVQEIEVKAHSEHKPETSTHSPSHKYADKIKEIQKRRARNQAKMKEDAQRISFLLEYGGDMFARAEHRYLYGKDL